MIRFCKTAATMFALVLAVGFWGSAGNVHSFAQPQTASTPPQRSSQRVEHSISNEGSEWRWRYSDNGIGLDVRIRGHVEFAENYSDITSISDGGTIQVTDERGGVTRKFEAKATAAGIQRSYWVDGVSRQFDQDAKTWLAKVLPLTHGLALMRYGLLGDDSGLQSIWGMHSSAGMASLSLAVVASFAAVLTVASIRVFTRSAVR